MKVNTFKKIEEGFFSDLARVGSDTMSNIKSSPDYQKKEKEKFDKKVKDKTQSRYLQDFIEDLIVDLDAAIKGGQINTVVSSTFSSGNTSAPTTPQPQQAVQPTNATRQAALQRSAQRNAPQQPEKSIDREEELANVAGLGNNESYNYSSFLNSLVEGYISEQATESISQWIMRWFAAYMQGVNWESDKAGVEAIAKEIESSYSKDRGKAAISKLANSSWKLIKDVDTTPYGARDVMNTNTPSNDSTLSDKELAKRIKDDTEKLKKTDPNLYDKIKNSLPESSKLRRKHHD
jgi:hypothetical protein